MPIRRTEREKSLFLDVLDGEERKEKIHRT